MSQTETVVSAEPSGSPIFVAKQPIFDRKGQIWGFELLFRGSGKAGEATFVDEDVATSQVLCDGFFLAAPGIEKGKCVLINFPQHMLLSGAAHTLPSDKCIIEILETVEPSPEVIGACQELKKAGFKLALDDFVGQPGYEELIALADIVKVDILGQTPQEVIRIFNTLKPYGCKLLAEKIENRKIFELTRKLGFDYFQGFFFKKPEIIPGKKISSNETSKLKLMQEIGKEDFDFKELAKTISHDVSISYRLLRYVNSAYFGQAKKVESLVQAIMILGQKQIVRWLRVIILSDMDAMGNAQAAALTSVQRARFLELLSESDKHVNMPSESMFFMGIFSMLDVLLGIPMEDVLGGLPLGDDVKDALLGRDDKARFWLELVENFEQANWDRISQMIKEKRLNPWETSLLYIEAMKWTREILGESTREE
ncbi:MAG: HDOD domain-containing protein [Desulfovibrio sp.]|nr:HDOD domain-containing protein [Desulfovibrio sp.]MBI4961274.1 HDOD domain-containing protein [Desulfovibrio sp.]